MELSGSYLDMNWVLRGGLGRWMLETHHSTNGLQSFGNGHDLLGKECDGEEERAWTSLLQSEKGEMQISLLVVITLLSE